MLSFIYLDIENYLVSLKIYEADISQIAIAYYNVLIYKYIVVVYNYAMLCIIFLTRCTCVL